MARHAAPSFEIASKLNAETLLETPARALRAGVAEDKTHGSSVDNNTKFLIEDIIEIFGEVRLFLYAHILIIRTGSKISSFQML